MLACCSQRVKHNEELRRIFSAACGEPAQENERVRRAAWCGSNIEVCVFTTPRTPLFPWPLIPVHERVRCDTKSHTMSEVPQVLRCPHHIITVFLITLTRFQVQGSANCPLAVSQQQCSVYILTLGIALVNVVSQAHGHLPFTNARTTRCFCHIKYMESAWQHGHCIDNAHLCRRSWSQQRNPLQAKAE